MTLHELKNQFNMYEYVCKFLLFKNKYKFLFSKVTKLFIIYIILKEPFFSNIFPTETKTESNNISNRAFIKYNQNIVYLKVALKCAQIMFFFHPCITSNKVLISITNEHPIFDFNFKYLTYLGNKIEQPVFSFIPSIY